MKLAEELALDYDTFVFTQSNEDVQAQCRVLGRAVNVKIMSCRLLTSSSSKIIYRAVEEIYFSSWVLMQLCLVRPSCIYIATDPPVITPLIVAIYSKIFGVKYIYHLQDIHPEASLIAFKMHFWLFALLKRLDNFTLKHAKSIVTLTPEMAEYIKSERGVVTPIYLLENASAYPSCKRQRIKNTIIFCGNAGRLQEIPLVISAIDHYLKQGGLLSFTFVGAGLYSNLIVELSRRWSSVSYLGSLPMAAAIEIISEHEWGLLPLNNEALKFAFPSKSSAYVAAGCKILAICGQKSSLAQWVVSNKRGIISPPEIDAIVNTFFRMECSEFRSSEEVDVINLVDYSFDFFATKLKRIITQK